MSETAKGSDLTLLEPIFDGLEDPAHALVGVLQRAQELYGHLPQDVLAAIADRLGLSPVMMIDSTTYGSLTPAKAKEIVRRLKAEG